MKRLIKYITISCVSLGFVLTSCNDDFMQRNPINNLAEGSFLKNEGDLPLYLNQLYNIYCQGHQTGNAYQYTPPFFITRGSQLMYGDIFTDNAIGFSNTSGDIVSRMQGTWQVPATAVSSLEDANQTGWRWGNLRTVNYFLNHYREAEGSVSSPDILNKWAAEAYFFKAWEYYQKIVAFGEVPWLETDLNVNSPELQSARMPREELANKVLECLDYAIEHLSPTGTADGRINKNMANFLKARFCLFEGTFRKYHTEVGLQSSANKFLEECVKACDAIVATGKYELYNVASTEVGNDPYWHLFKLNGLTGGNQKEAILARVYDADKLGHGTSRYFNMNRGNAAGRYCKGATKDLLDEYLCADGLPVTSSPLFKGYDGDDWRELDNRDPRLRQTVVKPGEYITIFDRDKGTIDRSANGLKYPEITYNCPTANQTPTGGPCVTGYMFIKHWTNETIDNGSTTNGSQTALIFRYGEVLLMLAEAKAELGTITNADLDLTVNALRKRAGFDFVKYPNSKLTLQNIPADARLDNLYQQYAGYVPSPILREIRRERRVEMAMEGLRREDLVRWKAGKFVEKPIRGMKFTTEKQKLYDGSNTSKDKNAPKATLNSDVFIDSDGFIIGYPKSPNVTSGVVKWNDRYYYNPIPLQELELNKNLTQSLGWQDINRN
ncbi:RagB/SusD family nutrient uptake outer membrane protein [Dysgonomonas sp.]